jgi:DNA-binding HxlR family transcriptional regulator
MCDPFESLSFPIDEALRLLGRRWYSQVLLEITRGATRYSDLMRALPRISPRTLSARISELETTGIIAKRGNKNIVNYEFTEKGRELIGIFNTIAAFSLHWHG